MTDASAAAAPATVEAVLADGTRRLRSAGSPTPRLDTELLVGHALERERAWLLAHPDAALGTDAVARLEAWLERRAAGEPIAYIRGFKEWLSLRVRTDARALIPRPETELLADAAIAEIAARLTADAAPSDAGAGAPIVAWDVATGSGAIALALALRFRTARALGRVRLVASDRSGDALALAEENLEANRVGDGVTLACSDLLESAGSTLPLPDVVVANLPYLTTADVVRGVGSIAHEPRIALDGGHDGLDVLRRLLTMVPNRCATGATVLLEVGAGQAEAVSGLAPEGASVSTMGDLAGIERVVRIHLP